MKKALKITGIAVLIIFALLIAIPFVFQGKINDLVKQFINQNLNAKVEFSDVSLSFIRHFPKAHVSVNDLLITNFKPFENDTLTAINNIAFTMSVKELFKSADQDPMTIQSIYIDEAIVNLKTDKDGHVNYDIAKPSESQATETKDSNFAFDIEDYKITNSTISFSDASSKMNMLISQLNHQGKGSFSADQSDLDTHTDALVSFSMDSTNYLNKNSIKLDAIIGLDLKNSKYSFKDNKGFINKLPIEFSGYLQRLENGQDIDITFENPESSFKNFLALIPEAYSKNIENVQTSGDFKVKGIIKGRSSEKTIPHFDISITSNNASFKYPDLPKSVENITINTSIKNETGKNEDTYIDIKALNFKIDRDEFKSSATLKHLTENMLVNANINGLLNLDNISKAYPITLETPLTGILKANLNTAFDMNAIETNAYQRIKNSGSASITDFVYTSKDMANPIHISNADIVFNPDTVSLNNFKAKTGDSDLNATGNLKNLMGFLLSDGNLQGEFKVNSNVFKVNDFMVEDETASENKTDVNTEPLKIPAFLDCVIYANANTVVYDNLNLKDVKGSLVIKDQKASLNDLTSSIFDGALSVTGDVSTKEETPRFNLNLNANDFDIAKSFNGMELLQNLAPIAKLLQGKLNTNLNFSGDLDQEFTPNLGTVSGNALAELLSTKISTDQTNLISNLEGALSFIDFDKLNLNDIKTKFEFAEGKVVVKPFQLTYEDINIEVSGSHGFDKTVNYNAVFNVPAKYLGSEVNNLIGKINTAEANTIAIPVTANITGSFTNPTVKTDLSSGVKNLTQQLIEIQKQKLLNQGKDKAKDMLNNLIGGNKAKTDSLKEEQNNTVKDVLGGIIGNKTPSDSTKTSTTNTVKNVLGGLLGKKKKQKDTVN
ncbi:AsmA-like C-terminal region-containing protein [Aestuariivivens insulae]|uniref:AsmA-like C-terminal region-containing protein n=1 Tax=Aestuariivivens insulae TaxID=1621988 RepID=UPI001F584A4D|nr:AsmA-like C-terminal region-containing protein [Aestuariivivens insulae]